MKVGDKVRFHSPDEYSYGYPFLREVGVVVKWKAGTCVNGSGRRFHPVVRFPSKEGSFLEHVLEVVSEDFEPGSIYDQLEVTLNESW